MDRQFSRFVRVVTLTVVVGVVMSVLAVLIVDPYGIYRWISVSGFNQVKLRPTRYQEEIKLAGAQRVNANALILGNSRADIGFDPEHSALKLRGMSGYNLAVPGASLEVSARQVDYLISRGQPLSYLLVGLDFLDFPVSPNDKNYSNKLNELASPVEKWGWRIDTLFSFASVFDAFETVKIQNNPYAEVMTDRGLNPLSEYILLAKQEGFYSFFRQRAEENATIYLHKPHSLLYFGSRPSKSSLALRRVLRLAAEHNINVDLVIYPYHAQILLMFENTGLWPLFLQWKKMLVDEVEMASQQYPGLHVNLWDFSGYAGPRCELIPNNGDKVSITRWYWEAGHFKRELGDLVVSRVLNQWSSTELDAKEFGLVLDSNSISKEPMRLAAEREVCRRQNPTLFNETEQIVQKMKSR